MIKLMTWNPPSPTFSGENSDKGDYYSFKEDWDHFVALKGTSVADQVRLLTRTCLTGVARAASHHLGNYHNDQQLDWDHWKVDCQKIWYRRWVTTTMTVVGWSGTRSGFQRYYWNLYQEGSNWKKVIKLKDMFLI